MSFSLKQITRSTVGHVFDLCIPMGTSSSPPEYNCLHDPHLRAFFSRRYMRNRLVAQGYITPSGEVLCTRREYNVYYHFLKSEFGKVKQLREECKKMFRVRLNLPYLLLLFLLLPHTHMCMCVSMCVTAFLAPHLYQVPPHTHCHTTITIPHHHTTPYHTTPHHTTPHHTTPYHPHHHSITPHPTPHHTTTPHPTPSLILSCYVSFCCPSSHTALLPAGT